MDPNVSEWLNLVFRWGHVIAGVMWIGHLWFFNFVNAQLAKTYDPESKKKVLPELMPRALYWFRWGAAWTWITGILLLGIVYYHGRILVYPDASVSAVVGIVISLGALVVGFVVYDVLWKSPVKQNALVGTIISVALISAAAWGLEKVFTERSVSIHVGAMFGTMMAANVWMRIWPAQRRIIAATAQGSAPDPADAAIAGMRSKHNTYMSVPLLLLMVSNHYPLAYGYKWATVFVVIGFLFTWWLYKKSTSSVTTKY